MKMNKLLFSFILVGVLILGGSIGAAASSNFEKIIAYLDTDIKLTIHGSDYKPLDLNGNPITPINYKDSTYLPLRAVAEAVGLPVEWDGKTRTAKLGYSSMQLNNYTTTSFVDIQINGGWRPSYLTPIKKIYSNSFMGVNFEIRESEGASLEDLVARNKEELAKYVEFVNTTTIELDGLKGQLLDYVSNDSHSQRAIMISNNSKEYYVIEVFVEKSKYEDNKSEIAKILNTFRKQR
ncbi:stalk domain-containing protein [Paenibacillus sp. strain BS8-2]